MDLTGNIMHKMTINEFPIIKSEIFRTPSSSEKEIGLWVDRIGCSVDSYKPSRLRILRLYAVVYVEKGEGFYITRKFGKIKVKGGESMIVFPNEPTYYYPKTKWETKWIVWSGLESQSLEKMGYIRTPVIQDVLESVRQAYFTLLKLKDKEDFESVLERKSIILQMILGLYKSSKARRSGLLNDTAMKTVLSHINEHLLENIQMSELSKIAKMSQTHFRRYFKHYTGRSPKNYMLSVKISKAKQYLSEGKSIKETSDLIGFSDVFYFMRMFKKMTGITINQFRY